jgi:hypothetical protein
MLSPLDHVLVWDLETAPDLPCVARVNNLDEADEAAARDKLGEKFPKPIFHAIVCIGALIAERIEGVWIVRSLGAPNVAERTEVAFVPAAWRRSSATATPFRSMSGGPRSCCFRRAASQPRSSRPVARCFMVRLSPESRETVAALEDVRSGSLKR